MKPKERIIVGLDTDTLYSAEFLVRLLKDEVGGFKIGFELMTAMLKSVIQPQLDETAIANATSIRRIFKDLKSGPDRKKIFWDIKLYDIPNTVGATSVQMAGLFADMFSVHASAGKEAIISAVKHKKSGKVFGVTVLTSADSGDCISAFGKNPESEVLRFAEILLEAGADGIICSPLEVRAVRRHREFNRLQIAAPGIRPSWYEKNDQARVMTPGEAVLAGADFLIIGRPILDPPPDIGNPADAARKIVEEIELASKKAPD